MNELFGFFYLFVHIVTPVLGLVAALALRKSNATPAARALVACAAIMLLVVAVQSATTLVATAAGGQLGPDSAGMRVVGQLLAWSSTLMSLATLAFFISLVVVARGLATGRTRD